MRKRAVSDIRLCTRSRLNFLTYEENLFYFLSVQKTPPSQWYTNDRVTADADIIGGQLIQRREETDKKNLMNIGQEKQRGQGGSVQDHSGAVEERDWIMDAGQQSLNVVFTGVFVWGGVAILQVLNLVRNRVLNSCRIWSTTQLSPPPPQPHTVYCTFTVLWEGVGELGEVREKGQQLTKIPT